MREVGESGITTKGYRTGKQGSGPHRKRVYDFVVIEIIKYRPQLVFVQSLEVSNILHIHNLIDRTGGQVGLSFCRRKGAQRPHVRFGSGHTAFPPKSKFRRPTRAAEG